MQQTSFPIEILVGEDESSDGTREICQRYATDYPERIRLFLRSRKDVIQIMGKPTGRANLLALLTGSRGKYIALCEGDDYWTDPLKLQQQVDRMEADDGLALCFHGVMIKRAVGELVPDYITKVPAAYETVEDLAIRGNYIHTPTVLFRASFLVLPPELRQSPLGDFFIWMIVALKGRLLYLPENMAVYREGGTWSGRKAYERGLATAITHAALATFLQRMGRTDLANILVSRIRHFFDRNRALVSATDKAYFATFPGPIQKLVKQAVDGPSFWSRLLPVRLLRRLIGGVKRRAIDRIARSKTTE